MTDPEVTTLQEFLAKDRSIYPRGYVTGHYGAATEDAVKAFQLLRGLSAITDPDFGAVNDATRVKLNDLYLGGKVP